MNEKDPTISLTIDILEPIINCVSDHNDSTELVAIKATLNKLKVDYVLQSNSNLPEEVQNLIFQTFENFPVTIDKFYMKLYCTILDFIDEANVNGIENLLKIGEKIFPNGIDLNEKFFEYDTPLYHSINKERLAITRLLLTKGACPNKFLANRASPLVLAIVKRKVDYVELILQHGVTTETLNGKPEGVNSPLYKAVELQELEIVRLLVGHGAKLLSVRNGLVLGDPCFHHSPLRLALEQYKPGIAKYFYTLIKSDNKIFEENINIFLKYAPLELLEFYIDDSEIPIERKLATAAITRVSHKIPTETMATGELLLKYLLSETHQEEKRLSLIKKLIQQWMRLEKLEVNKVQKDCSINKSLLAKLARETIDYPIVGLAKTLLQSIELSQKQGRCNIGFSIICVYASFHDAPFKVGVRYLDHLKTKLTELSSWPDEVTIDAMTEHSFQIFKSVTHPDNTIASLTNLRFMTLAGSAIFSDSVFVPLIKDSGASYFKGIINIIVKILRELHLLGDLWSEGKVQQIFLNIEKNVSKFYTGVYAIPNCENIYTSFLQVPNHRIPVLIYKYNHNWIYTLICRSFLQSEKSADNAIVEFIITEPNFTEVLPQINEELSSYTADSITNDDDIHIEINYRLLKHILFMEKLLNVRGTYSASWHHKPFKIPACFALNIKPLLFIIIKLIAKQPLTLEQLKIFNDRVSTCIKDEIKIANVTLSVDDICVSEKLSAEKMTYKLLTLLLRWQEINRYVPSTSAEIQAKEKTIDHVLHHTQVRFSIIRGFFKKDYSMSKYQDQFLLTLNP